MITRIDRRQLLQGIALGTAAITSTVRAGLSEVGNSSNSGPSPSALFEDHIAVPLSTEHTHRGYTGSLAILRDGSLLFACANPLNEIQESGIIGRISTDGGRRWGQPFSMQRNFARLETISPSLLRLKSGDLLFGYVVENNYEGPDLRLYDSHFYVRRSTDEGRTWEDQFCATMYPGCHTVNPGHVIQLSSGRIIVPAEWTEAVGGGEAGHMVCLCYYCDNGYTWIRSRNFVDTGSTTEEPSIVELKDGRLLMVFRNLKGYVGRAYSPDGGDTWSDTSFYTLPSGLAPQYVTRIPKTGDLLLLWLNNPYAPARARGEHQPFVKVAQLNLRQGEVRAPQCSAISQDEGQSWNHIREITSDPKGDYGYQSVCFVDDAALVTYHALDGIHVTRIGIDWFYGK